MSTINKKLTIGLDLGDKKISVCVLDGSGEVVERLMIRNTMYDLSSYFDNFSDPSKVTVGMEAGTHSPWISAFLHYKEFNVLVGNARKLRAIWQSDTKDDTHDAEMIARICRFDRRLMHPIRHRSRQSQCHLAIIKARDGLVRSRSDLVNTVRGLAKAAGCKLPSCSTDAFPKKVAPEIPGDLWVALSPLLDTIGALSSKIRNYDKTIDGLCCADYKETKTLRQIAGVGPVTSLAFVLTLEDPTRFSHCRTVGPFLGLVPKRDQSGESNKPLPITKAGNTYLRQLLVGSANYIMGSFGPDCDLRR